MNEKISCLVIEELESIQSMKSTAWYQGFFGGLGAAGMVGGLIMGGIITLAT